MIFNLFINLVLLIFGSLFVFLPVVSLSSIPYVGTGISTYLTLAVQYWNTFLLVFPYSQIVWSSFLYVIIPFEITLLIAKFFLGHRLPAHLN